MRRWELTGSEYTKYWRVNIMWHTAEIVKIFEKMDNGIVSIPKDISNYLEMSFFAFVKGH